MTLLEKLKSLFNRDEIPDEAKQIFDSARSSTELLRGLDQLLTRNEVEAKELNDEISKIEEIAGEEEERIRLGGLPERQKRNTLLKIKRLRKQMDNYEGRLRIYERNMNLHLNLIGKIQQMEAMKLGGVDEAKIDEIVMEFEEKLEKYADTMNAAEAHELRAAVVSAKEERQLRDLEAEIVKRNEPVEVEVTARERVREGEAALARRTEAPEPERERPRRPPIEEVVDHAMAEDAATAAPGEETKKRVELE